MMGISRVVSRLKEYQSDAIWGMVNTRYPTSVDDEFWRHRSEYFEHLVGRLISVGK